MMESMDWGTFLLWGIFDLVIAVVAFFFLRETKGLSLEAIAHQRFKKGGSSDGLAVKVADEGETDSR